jgi:hypothetical protein
MRKNCGDWAEATVTTAAMAASVIQRLNVMQKLLEIAESRQ